MKDLVHLQDQRLRDVVAEKLEAGMAEETLHVSAAPREEVVEADDVVTFCDQAVAQMGAEEPGTACHEDPLSHRELIPGGGRTFKRPPWPSTDERSLAAAVWRGMVRSSALSRSPVGSDRKDRR